MPLTDLPEEVLQDIFAELDPKSLRQCTQTCKAFYDLVEDSVALQYKFALELAGYIDGPPTNLISTAERLRRLTEHQKAWRELSKWRQVDLYHVDNKSTTYELYGGVYAQGTQNLQSGSLYTRGFEMIEFPSLLRNMPEGHTWSIEDLGFDVKDFGMDPDRNLLVAIESTPRRTWKDQNPPLSVHLLTLREEDARAHPMAAVPILKYRPRIWHPTYNFWIQVSGDLLAVLFRPGTGHFNDRPDPPAADELVIWRWRTGKSVMRIHFGNTVAQSFSFLANDLILVPCVVDNIRPLLKLYRLPQDTGSGVLVARFGCPPMQDTVLRCYVICRTDPSPYAPAPRGPSRKEDSKAFDDIQVVWPAHGAAPFAPHPSNRLIVLSFSLIARTRLPHPGGGVESRSFTGFAKAKTLLALWQCGTSGKDGVVDIPWEDWGPENTRFLAEEAEENCVCYVYGMRYGSMVDVNGSRVIRILDFNDAEFTRELQKPSDYSPPSPPQDPFSSASAIEAQPLVESPEIEEEQGEIEILEDDDDEEWTDESSSESSQLDDGDDDHIKGFHGLRISGAEARHRCQQLRIAYEPSYWIDKSVFKSKLETSLPFRWTLTRRPETAETDVAGSFLRVMIDDEHIIGVKRYGRGAEDEFGRVRIYVLTV